MVGHGGAQGGPTVVSRACKKAVTAKKEGSLQHREWNQDGCSMRELRRVDTAAYAHKQQG